MTSEAPAKDGTQSPSVSQEDQNQHLEPNTRELVEWQPIESAPKDGSRLLGWIVYAGDAEYSPDPFQRPSIIYWDEGCTNPGWERASGWQKEWIGDVTHWQPIIGPADTIEALSLRYGGGGE